ncbi:MAG: HAD hydrolase family protein [Spirochaetes bacterium]|nr:HAD hydrolase family protein [Spirochaetota bacterium]
MLRYIRYKTMQQRLARISMIVCDVDGVLTDGRLIVTDRGYELKHFHSKDGFAVHFGKTIGLSFGIITARSTEAVQIRFKKQLKLDEVHDGVKDKGRAFQELCARRKLTPEQVAYAGDELIDLPAMHRAGVSFAPRDAAAEVRRAASWVTSVDGGRGVLREIVMLIARAQGRYHEAVQAYRG